jgi:hypothetical protein
MRPPTCQRAARRPGVPRSGNRQPWWLLFTLDVDDDVAVVVMVVAAAAAGVVVFLVFVQVDNFGLLESLARRQAMSCVCVCVCVFGLSFQAAKLLWIAQRTLADVCRDALPTVMRTILGCAAASHQSAAWRPPLAWRVQARRKRTGWRARANKI